jgi:hypothetical protein
MMMPAGEAAKQSFSRSAMFLLLIVESFWLCACLQYGIAGGIEGDGGFDAGCSTR